MLVFQYSSCFHNVTLSQVVTFICDQEVFDISGRCDMSLACEYAFFLVTRNLPTTLIFFVISLQAVAGKHVLFFAMNISEHGCIVIFVMLKLTSL
jgi:hypothetical protein